MKSTVSLLLHSKCLQKKQNTDFGSQYPLKLETGTLGTSLKNALQRAKYQRKTFDIDVYMEKIISGYFKIVIAHNLQLKAD